MAGNVKKKAAAKQAKPLKGTRGAKGSARSKKGGKGWIIFSALIGVLLLLAAETYFQARSQAKLKFDMVRVGRIIPQGSDKGQGMAVVNFEGDKQDNLWFLEGAGDAKPRLQKFDPQGNSLGVYEPRKPEQLLTGPKDVTTDSAGNAYVLLDDKVQIIDPNLKYVASIKYNLAGSTSIGIDSKGTLYIASDPANKVLMIDLKGKVLGEFGAPGTHSGDLVGPIRMRVSSTDQVLVLERLPAGLRVKVFGTDHKLARQFDIKDLQNSVPLKMGVNINGKVFFNDATGSRGMIVYDSLTGKFVGDAQATKDGEKFVSPGAVGANKWTPSVYLHTVVGLIKCLLPSAGDAQ